ncbi:MAG: beta-ketoacyl synthase chain length factor [Alphaproteobacteria bacterium]|nr:beta-ketoacyl synthase chain length factor [Alphaproteobacteria bacterium]
MKPLHMYLNAITFCAPGAESWDALCALFNGADFSPPDDWRVVPECLSGRTARRVSPQILLALTVAERIGGSLPEDAGWVFASSAGEGETLQVILEMLSTPDMLIQPLRFQNAVHNAAAGQWSVAAKITGPMTSIAAHKETVGAGFMKAALQVALEARPVGLVIYDVPFPEPLDQTQPLGLPIGAGFALSPDPGPATLAAVEVTTCDSEPTTAESEIARALQATGNPVAAALPLLEKLAGGDRADIVLAIHGGGALQLRLEPA